MKNTNCYWIDSQKPEPDVYAAFRGGFELDGTGEVELHILGAAWFELHLDGEFLTEGPARFEASHPEYEVRRIRLSAGRHLLAAKVNHIGIETRILSAVQPFFYCRAFDAATREEIPIAWRCRRLEGFESGVRRINPQLGWVEWCDTRRDDPDWNLPDFDDVGWKDPVTVATGLGEFQPLDLAPVRRIMHRPELIGQGEFSITFGYDRDDLSAGFFLRNLDETDLPPDGIWRRYDLGRVRLARPYFELDLPAGSIVEFAYTEQLVSGRVAPWITLSAGTSCNLDHYVARGGRQVFAPLTPKGGRYVEIHVLAPSEKIQFIREEFAERVYHAEETVGHFECGDPLLDRIWQVGAETYRACTEDAVTDNPTRERGQWTGDVVAVGMNIAVSAWNDLRLPQRGLRQSALCAREDGMVAGLCPGGVGFLSSYALLWISACLRSFRQTGNRALLEELYPFAVRNLDSMEAFRRDEGLSREIDWPFIDWGYVTNEGPSDMALNMHHKQALTDAAAWARLIDQPADAERFKALADKTARAVKRWLEPLLREGDPDWDAIGYHRAFFALDQGLLSGLEEEALAFIKRHMLHCFPNDPSAPRLSRPAAENPRLITPYFAHYAFPPLFRHGETDFILEQYRICWGWMLEQNETTWLEVFDTRWSHCHQWSGCPTWQLSRMLLGMERRFDLGPDHFVLDLYPGTELDGAKGRVPLADEGAAMNVSWTRHTDGLSYRVETEHPVYIRVRAVSENPDQPFIRVEGTAEFKLDGQGRAITL